MPEAAAAPSAAQVPALASVLDWIEVPAQAPDSELSLELNLVLHLARPPVWRAAPPASARWALSQELKPPARWLPAANCCCPPSRLDR